MIGIIKATGERVSLRGPFKNTSNPSEYWNEWGSKNRWWSKDEVEVFTPDRKAFLREFKDLLAKYEACIYWACGEGSDTHGIYDSQLKISLNDIKFIELEDDYVTAKDIKIK